MRLPWRATAAPSATTDQVLAAVTLVGRKIDTLLQEAGIIMTQSDDILAATNLLNAEVPVINQSFTDLTALIATLRAGQPVPQATMDGFDAALGKLKPSVDKIATLTAATPPPPPPPPPAGP